MTAYSNLVFLKEDLERIVSMDEFARTFTLRKREFVELYRILERLNSLSPFESAIAVSFIDPFSPVVSELMRDLDTLFSRERFRKHCKKVVLLEIKLISSIRDGYFRRSRITMLIHRLKAAANMGMSRLFCIDEFQELYHYVSLINVQLTSSMGRGYLDSEIRDVVVSLKTDIEKDLEHLIICKEDMQKFIDNVSFGDQEESNFIKNLVLSMNKELENSTTPLLHRNIQRLYDSVSLLVSLLKKSREESYSRELMIDVQNRIRDVAYKAAVQLGGRNEVPVTFEKSIVFTSLTKEEESAALVDMISDMPKKTQAIKMSFDPMLDLPKLIEEIVYLNEELMKIHKDREEIGKPGPQNSEGTTSTTAGTRTYDTGNPAVLSSPRSSRSKDGKLVGLGNDLNKMLDCLTGETLRLKVFPITGMAGIGKTTFARELYHHPVVMHYFDTRAWVTVSQDYQLRGLLLGLLSGLTNPSNEDLESSNESLREKLYRCLKGKRYLVVLDDVWNNLVWDDLRRSFPNDMNGSRILLTSRLQDVSIHTSPDVPPHCLPFLNIEESWELFCSKCFANDSCPIELLPIGRQIVHKCHGLPLAIVVVGGLLSKMNKTLTVWEEVARNVGSLVMDGPQHCQDILALSYNNLPDPLKPCFLYMAIFPEDYEISSRKLISLWIAEGFVQPEEQKSLEEIAEDYLEDLIARCIILVKQKKSNGTIKTCSVHDLMRDFCLKESQKENFLDVFHNLREMPINDRDAIQKYGKCTYDCLRLSIHSNFCSFTKFEASSQCARSFFCFENLGPTDLKGCPGIIFCKLLKVLDIMHIHLSSLPSGMLLLINLKYLALTIQDSFSLLELCKLGRLQTCIIDGEFSGHIPDEFWWMTELRHFYLRKRIPVSHHRYSSSASMFPSSAILQNLRALSTVSPSSCTEQNFIGMPNLKKLGVYESEEDYQFVGWYKNLVHLTQLETLKYTFSNPFGDSRVRPRHCLPWAVFPSNLKKLTLGGTSFPWEDMKQLTMLPRLEVLKLKNYAFSGVVWKLGESCFECLKFLMIGSTNLEVWEADGSHFPSLEQLVLRNCRFLKEIPRGIGDARWLERIEMQNCADSAAASAIRLLEEQQDLGNDLLKIYVTRR